MDNSCDNHCIIWFWWGVGVDNMPCGPRPPAYRMTWLRITNVFQPKHTVGMGQTWTTQVTDVRFARLGKVVAEETKQRLRRLHRIKAKRQSAAAPLVSKHWWVWH